MKPIFLSIFCLLLSITGCAHSQTAAEKNVLFFGHDDRTYTKPDTAPWNAIGRIETSSGSICTGTLIAPNLVMTAAHCFVGAQRRLDPAVLFSLGLDGQQSVALQPEKVIVDKRFMQQLIQSGDDWIIPPSIAHQDIALVTLRQAAPVTNRPIPLFQGSHADLISALKTQKNTITQGGYPTDHEDRLMVHHGGHVVRVTSNNLIEHQCDTLAGDSGSPIFLMQNGQATLIGIQSSAPDAMNRRAANNIAVATTVIGQSSLIGEISSAIGAISQY